MRKEKNVKEREINGFFVGAAELGLPLPPAQAIQSQLGKKRYYQLKVLQGHHQLSGAISH